MNLFKDIIDIILFRFSFTIQTNLDKDYTRDLLYTRFNQDKSFINFHAENYKFAFCHKIENITFPFNLILSAFIVFIPYTYYIIKMLDVKSILNHQIQKQEKGEYNSKSK